MDRGKINLQSVCLYQNTEQAVAINDQYPDSNSDDTHSYSNLNLEMNHTGTILIGRDVIRSEPVGFPCPEDFADLREFTFDSGQISQIDPSPKSLEDYRNWWWRHAGIATSLPIRNEFGLDDPK